MKNLETIEDFIAAYLKLRDMQNKYFRLKYYEDLKKAKAMEKELDQQCLRYVKNKATQQQQKLF